MLHAHSYHWLTNIDLISAWFLENCQVFSHKLACFIGMFLENLKWLRCFKYFNICVIISVGNCSLFVKTPVDFIRKRRRKKYSNWKKKLERYFSIFNFHNGVLSFKPVSQETSNLFLELKEKRTKKKNSSLSSINFCVRK